MLLPPPPGIPEDARRLLGKKDALFQHSSYRESRSRFKGPFLLKLSYWSRGPAGWRVAPRLLSLGLVWALPVLARNRGIFPRRGPEAMGMEESPGK